MIHALMTSQLVDAVLQKQKPLYWASSTLEMLWIAFWSAMGTIIIFFNKRSPIKIMSTIIIALALLFTSCWLCLVNGVWLLAIAPAVGLILSASFSLAYSRK